MNCMCVCTHTFTLVYLYLEVSGGGEQYKNNALAWLISQTLAFWTSEACDGLERLMEVRKHAPASQLYTWILLQRDGCEMFSARPWTRVGVGGSSPSNRKSAAPSGMRWDFSQLRMASRDKGQIDRWAYWLISTEQRKGRGRWWHGYKLSQVCACAVWRSAVHKCSHVRPVCSSLQRWQNGSP